MIFRCKLHWMVGCLVALCSCTGGYSFTGASIPVDAKTISIQMFPNNARLVQPQLSQVFTDALRNRFMGQTPLTLVEYDGDLDLSGEITDYTTVPVGIQADDQAASNRFTITVRVKFVNKKDPKANFDQKFSRYKDYNSQENFSSVEEGYMNQICKELIDDIFNKSVANW